MNTETKALIRERAARLAPYLHDQLRYGGDTAEPALEMAYKFCFLLLRGPRAFAHMFRNGELRLDAELVDDVWWSHRGQIPGPHGLINEERQIIATHNEEVRLLLAREQVRHLHVVGAIPPAKRI